jgi:hypothetical protein
LRRYFGQPKRAETALDLISLGTEIARHVPETLGDAEVEALARKIKANGRLLAEVFGAHHTSSFPLLRVLFFGS